MANAPTETAYELRETRRVKPVIALIDCCAASAAYWLASQCTDIVMTPSSEVGSIGCWTLHIDESQALEKAGIRPTFILQGNTKSRETRPKHLATPRCSICSPSSIARTNSSSWTPWLVAVAG
jgi:hypothetical protein